MTEPPSHVQLWAAAERELQDAIALKFADWPNPRVPRRAAGTYTSGSCRDGFGATAARMPPLARWLPGLGIVATLAANVPHGLGLGLIGASVASRPAVALISTHKSCRLATSLHRVRRKRQQAGMVAAAGPI